MNIFNFITVPFKNYFAKRKLRKEIGQLEALHLKAYLAAAVVREQLEHSGMAFNRNKIAKNFHIHRRNANHLNKRIAAKRGQLRALEMSKPGLSLALNH